MCGIAGIFAYGAGAPSIERNELLDIREAMARRGPDGSGDWISPDGRVGLAHRRLAIIDLGPGGAQPMSSAEGRFTITFNGEIYNYRELRRELAAGGAVFRSNSDTEVLLHLYAERGEKMVGALRGMFAFAIWDAAERSLFLARDPFGVKPLYVADDGATLRFASQVKALVAGGAVSRDPDPAGHVGFFLLGSVPEPHTMYRAIRSVPAGHCMTVRDGRGATTHCHFEIAHEAAAATEAFEAARPGSRREYLRAALADSVAHHMVADVPVGLFLSAGIDSNTVAALACRLHRAQIRSVTLGFDEYRGTPDDEVPLAAAAACTLDTQHSVRWVTREAFAAEFDAVMDAMDQPSIDGVNAYFVSKAAAECGMKVALSGLGGDELFGGYPSFRDVPRMARMFAFARSMPALGRAMRRLAAPLLRPLMSPKFAGLLEYGGTYEGAYLLRRALYMPWEVRDFLEPRMFADGMQELRLLDRLAATMNGLRAPHQRVAALELSWYMRNQLLRDADWAGMAHSLEIRVPFVDPVLFRAVIPLLAGAAPLSKSDLLDTVTEALPRDLAHRRKTGFSIPVAQWAQSARSPRGPERPFRHWAHIVYRPHKRMRGVALLSDAFGGHGGIALYNRDVLTALAATPQMEEVVAIPRLNTPGMPPVPRGVTYRKEAANGKMRFIRTAVNILFRERAFDLVLCCHINLLPVAFLMKLRFGCPMVLFIYGIDAWDRQPWLKRRLLRSVDQVVSISDVTRRKFQAWARLPEERIAILPNAIHLEWYGAGARDASLVRRYGLEGKVVLMTLGRLISTERYKGFDEVLEVLPALVAENPAVTYLIAGDGSDRGRLERKAQDLGVAAHVRFTGLIPEHEKADHYRLADAFVMPSRGEGFGFVLLEAMACGVPTVASALDGGREALRGGELGTLVDPRDREDVRRGIRRALQQPRGAPPEGLRVFDTSHFAAGLRSIVRELVVEREAFRR